METYSLHTPGMRHDQLPSVFPHVHNQVICGRESTSASAQGGEEFLRLRRRLETHAGRFGLVLPIGVVKLNLLRQETPDSAVISWDSLHISPPSGHRFRYRRGFDRLHRCSLHPFKRSRAFSSRDRPRFDDGKTTLSTCRRLLRDI